MPHLGMLDEHGGLRHSLPHAAPHEGAQQSCTYHHRMLLARSPGATKRQLELKLAPAPLGLHFWREGALVTSWLAVQLWHPLQRSWNQGRMLA